MSHSKEIALNRNAIEVALQGIAMAMGVAVIVLVNLNTLDVQNGVVMPDFRLTALALARLPR